MKITRRQLRRLVNETLDIPWPLSRTQIPDTPGDTQEVIDGNGLVLYTVREGGEAYVYGSRRDIKKLLMIIDDGSDRQISLVPRHAKLPMLPGLSAQFFRMYKRYIDVPDFDWI